MGGPLTKSKRIERATLGGTARAAKLSAKERRKIARVAAIVRWHAKAQAAKV